jgi:hypothetical protein
MTMVGLVAVTIFATGGALGAQAAVSSPGHQTREFVDVDLMLLSSVPVPDGTTTTTTSTSATPTTTPTPTSTTTTPTTTPPAVLAATPVAPAAPAPPPAPPAPPAVPAYGGATAWGCSAALAYLQAYAAPGFALNCPGYAEGHEAMTCLHGTPQYPEACPTGPTIAISDPCPQAYMNESANSWLMTGQLSTEQQKFGASYGSIDPFGACP